MTRDDVEMIVEDLRARLMEEVGAGEKEARTPAEAAQARLLGTSGFDAMDPYHRQAWMFKEGVRWVVNDIRGIRSTDHIDEGLTNWAERFLGEVEERGTA